MKEYSIFEIQDLMEKGKLSAEDLVEKYIRQIEQIDESGPSLNSIIEVNQKALEIAKNLDEEREQNGPRGLMHGIPVIIKDNIETTDGMMTTAGSIALEGNFAKDDAFVVKKLKNAGAIILGKANLSEWANFRGRNSTSGWSSRGGQTKNPYALDRNPCGSSSGSAVAVAANLTTVALGTETDGSIICPSRINGIVGIKPTVGLLSRSGVIPIAHTQDTVGPMGRNVTDAAILLGAMVGSDPNDPITENSDQKGSKDYTEFLDEHGIENTRIGVLRQYFGSNSKVNRIIENSLKTFEDKGGKLIDPVEIEIPDELGKAEYNVLLYEYKHDLNNYLADLDENIAVHSIDDVIKFNDKYSELVLPYFGQEHMIAAQEKGDYNSEEYIEAMTKYEKLRNNFNDVFSEHNLDALVTSSGGPAWLTDHINGDSFTGSSSNLAAITGYCSITIPAGYISGLPIGLSIIGQAFDEPNIIKIGYSFEQSTQVRIPPKFLPNATP